MEPEKNLHAAVSASLLARAEAVALQEQITLDELVSDAMERRLNRREFEEVLAFGKRHAKARGLKPSDVAEAIAWSRAMARRCFAAFRGRPTAAALPSWNIGWIARIQAPLI